MNAYTIRDSKAKNYAVPFFAQNDAMAIRSFIRGGQDVNSFLCSHPEDFSLYRIGTYDDNTGRLTPADPEIVGKLVDLEDSAKEARVQSAFEGN